jgi:hypothetical protein
LHVKPGCVLNWGAGMLDADPCFVDSRNQDFHLCHHSPVKDQGDDTAPGMAVLDCEGDPRIAEGAVDMGADEFYTHLYYTGEAAPGGTVRFKFIGPPGGSPVALFYGLSLQATPIPTGYGPWYLGAPAVGPLFLPPLPAPSGVQVFTETVPVTIVPPVTGHLQAFIHDRFSNLCTVIVK